MLQKDKQRIRICILTYEHRTNEQNCEIKTYRIALNSMTKSAMVNER